jgi:hypothetical protein
VDDYGFLEGDWLRNTGPRRTDAMPGRETDCRIDQVRCPKSREPGRRGNPMFQSHPPKSLRSDRHVGNTLISITPGSKTIDRDMSEISDQL